MDLVTVDIFPTASGMYSVSAAIQNTDGATTWPDQPTIEDCLDCARDEIKHGRGGGLLVALECIRYWIPEDSDFEDFVGVEIYKWGEWDSIDDVFDPAHSEMARRIDDENTDL